MHKNKHIVPFLSAASVGRNMDALAALLQGMEKQSLSHSPWINAYPAKPLVQFAIAYSEKSFYLQFDVAEDFIQAAYGRNNEPVYQDSCVEFFVSFNSGETYYNFEFNSIGTVLAAYGPSKQSREFLPEDLLQQVECRSLIQRGSQQPAVSWQLTVVIPFSVFPFHTLSSLSGKQCSANVYKCGDNLPEPHFLCWSPVESEEPNFHLPEYFGTFLFGPGGEKE